MTFRMKVYTSKSRQTFDGVVKTPIDSVLISGRFFSGKIRCDRILRYALCCILVIMLAACKSTMINNPPAKAGTGTKLLKSGEAALAAGDIDAALELMEKACKRENFISVADWYRALNRLGLLCFKTGKIDKGVSLLKMAEKSEWQIQDKAIYIDFLNLYGSLLSANGDCIESIGTHEKALQLSRQHNTTGHLSDTWANLGISYARCSDFSSAVSAFKKGLALLNSETKAPNGPVADSTEIKKARIILNLVSALSDAGDHKSAADVLINTSFRPSNILSEREATAALLSWTEAAYKTAQHCPAGQKKVLIQKVLRQLRLSENRFKEATAIQTEIAGTMGRFYLLSNNNEKALACFRRAVFLSVQENTPQLQYYWQWQLAELFSRTGKREAAVNAYKKAVDKLTPIRGALLAVAGNSARERELLYNEKIKPVYSGLAALLLKKSDEVSTPETKTALILEARGIMDQLKNYELQDYFNDECIICLPENQNSRNIVLNKTAIIYPLMFKESLSLIITLPSGIRHIKVDITENELSTIARRFRQRLQSRRGNRFNFYGKQLYTHLIRPVEPLLKKEQIDTLVIVPEGPLRLVPWSAFYNGKSYLAELYATTIVPSLSVGLRVGNGKPEGDVLLCGLSENKNGAVILPNVPDELAQLQKITGGTVLLNQDFTDQNLKETLRADDYSIVHLATHGWVGDESNDIHLETYGGEMRMKTLESLISIGRFRKNRVSLLTISACDSGMGDERAAMGLGGLALRAGAESAVVTLWSISDDAAADLFADFYDNLTRKNLPKAKALQAAYIRMIHSKTHSHPAYWASFLLVGDWM